MKQYLIIFCLLTFNLNIFGQNKLLHLSITNQRFADVSNPSSESSLRTSLLLFDIVLQNASSETVEYSSGQIFLQTMTRYLNGGTAFFYLVNSDLPDSLLFKSVAAYENLDTLQLCCIPKKPLGRGKGFHLAAGNSMKIGTFGLKTTSSAGFSEEPAIITWRNYINSALPFTQIIATKGTKLVEISKECDYLDSAQ